MKILLLGNKSNWAIEHEYETYLKNIGELKFFDSHGLFLNYYHSSIFNKLIFRLGLSSIFKRINKGIIKAVNEFNPEVVFVFKGMEIYPSTLKEIKKSGAYLINYNPDHPFEYATKGSGNDNVLKSISLFDHHFTYSLAIKNELLKRFNVESTWLPFAYSFLVPPKKEIEVNRICFIGNPDTERVRVANLLVENKVPIDLYGTNWKKFVNSSSLCRIFGPKYQDEFVETAQKYKAHLNIFRAHNINSHNMRTFEIPALGEIMIAPKSKEHSSFFEAGKEAFFFENDNELVELAKHTIALSEEEAFVIKHAAYLRSKNDQYSYAKRAKLVGDFLLSLPSNT